MSEKLKSDLDRRDEAWLVTDFLGIDTSSFLGSTHDARPPLALPDYHVLSLLGTGTGEELRAPVLRSEAASIFLQFQKILLDQKVRPLLLEFAVIRDRRDSTSLGDSFVSRFACFAESPKGEEILKAWKSLVKLLISESSAENYSRLDLVPNPRTYEYVFHATSLKLCGHDTDVNATPTPIFDSSSYELSGLVEPHKAMISLPENMRRMADLLVKCVQHSQPDPASPISDYWLFVVPFFRVIEYAEASVNSFWENFGGRPGGCLIGLLHDDGGTTDSLRLALIRLSWLLHKGAFAETDRYAQEHRYRRDLLRKLGHAVKNPMVSAGKQLDRLVQALAPCEAVDSTIKQLAEVTRSRFHASLTATRCIEYFVYLGPDSDPDSRGRIERELRTGRTVVGTLLEQIANEEFLLENNTPLEYHLPPNRVLLAGDSDAWWLILYLVIKNASEASPRGASVKLDVAYNDRLARAEIRVTNKAADPISAPMINLMNRALNCSVNHLPPNGNKASSLGLGIVTVGQVLRAWGLRGCAFRSTEAPYKDLLLNTESNTTLVILEIRDIPSLVRQGRPNV